MKKHILNILTFFFSLIAGVLYPQELPLSILPIEGLSPQENSIILPLLRSYASEASGMVLAFPPLEGNSKETQNSGYTLRGRIDKTESEKFFILSIHSSPAGLLISGAERPYKTVGDILILIPEMAKELFPITPLPQKIAPLPSEAGVLIFGGGIESFSLPFPDVQASSNLAVTPFTGSPKGAEVSSMFSNGLEIRKSFTLVPFAQSNAAHDPENPAFTPRPHFILSGEITEKKYVSSLKITLASVNNLAQNTAGPWYFSSEKSLQDFIPLAIDELLGYRTNSPWQMLLSARKDMVRGLSLEKTLNSGIESRNGIGETPIIIASRNGWADITEALLAENAQLKAADYQGWTALHWAASSDNTDILNMLIQAQAPLNSRNAEGWTPLICAVIRGRKEHVISLLNAGSNPRLKDKKGADALRWAQILGYPSIEKLLKEYQAPKL